MACLSTTLLSVSPLDHVAYLGLGVGDQREVPAERRVIVDPDGRRQEEFILEGNLLLHVQSQGILLFKSLRGPCLGRRADEVQPIRYQPPTTCTVALELAGVELYSGAEGRRIVVVDVHRNGGRVVDGVRVSVGQSNVDPARRPRGALGPPACLVDQGAVGDVQVVVVQTDDEPVLKP